LVCYRILAPPALLGKYGNTIRTARNVEIRYKTSRRLYPLSPTDGKRSASTITRGNLSDDMDPISSWQAKSSLSLTVPLYGTGLNAATYPRYFFACFHYQHTQWETSSRRICVFRNLPKKLVLLWRALQHDQRGFPQCQP